jgi:hypothetical protein
VEVRDDGRREAVVVAGCHNEMPLFPPQGTSKDISGSKVCTDGIIINKYIVAMSSNPKQYHADETNYDLRVMTS